MSLNIHITQVLAYSSLLVTILLGLPTWLGLLGWNLLLLIRVATIVHLLLMLLHLNGCLQLLLWHLLVVTHKHRSKAELRLGDKWHFAKDRELLLNLVAVLLVRLKLRRHLHRVLLLREALKVWRALTYSFAIEARLLEMVRRGLLSLYLLLLLLSRVAKGLKCLLSLELARQGERRLWWEHTYHALHSTLRLRLSQALLWEQQVLVMVLLKFDLLLMLLRLIHMMLDATLKEWLTCLLGVQQLNVVMNLIGVMRLLLHSW